MTIQVGGNDQWGNITAGIDLINRIQPIKNKGLPFGITVPLLTTATGEKFGKSAGNAVFIDPSINTAYDVYQFFYNTLDADVPKFLKIFTFLNSSEIKKLWKRISNHPVYVMAKLYWLKKSQICYMELAPDRIQKRFLILFLDVMTELYLLRS